MKGIKLYLATCDSITNFFAQIFWLLNENKLVKLRKKNRKVNMDGERDSDIVGGKRGGVVMQEGSVREKEMSKDDGETSLVNETSEGRGTDGGGGGQEGEEEEIGAGQDIVFGIRLESLLEDVRSESGGGEEPGRKRRRIDVEEFMSTVVFDPSRHCHYSKGTGHCRELQTHGKLCSYHATEKFLSCTPKFSKFTTVESLLKHLVRTGMYRLKKMERDDTLALNLKGAYPWLDGDKDRYGQEFGEDCVALAKRLLEKSCGGESYLQFTSGSTLEIDLDAIITKRVDVDASTFLMVYRLFAVCTARAVETNKMLFKKGDVRLHNCRLLVELSSAASRRYHQMNQLQQLRPLYSAESFSDSFLCYLTPLQGRWEYEYVDEALAVKDCVVSMKAVVPHILSETCMPLQHDGRLEDTNLRERLSKDCEIIFDHRDRIGGQCAPILPGQSVLNMSNVVYRFTPCVTEDDDELGTGVGLRRRAVRSTSSVSVSSTSAALGYDSNRHVAYFHQNIDDCDIALVFASAPTMVASTGPRVNAATLSRLIHGYLSKKWFEIRKLSIDNNQDFDRNSVPLSVYRDYIYALKENGAWTPTIAKSTLGKLLLKNVD